ncbi:MAG: phosphoadenylyl-sulfate reductase [Acidobacteriia bacterium]|nr:phosphoadenylyl-sulfate reductase [Terriglobia bacterium]
MTKRFAITQSLAETWDPEQLLRWAFSEFYPEMAIASGFGAEGIVLIDIAARIRPDVRVFTLDTDFLFPETNELIGRIEERYRIKVERVRPALTPEEQERRHGPALWKRAPDQCCNLRKVEPLRGKLSELRAWVTAIRRDQTASRAQARKVEWDTKFGLVKINPLADWSTKQVWDYVYENNLPYNPLHDRNYPSIGCTHCTRPIHAGEDARAGRWSGFEKTECGLHERGGPQILPVSQLGPVGD